MGFQIEINSIVRSDDSFQLTKGAVNDFRKIGSRIFFDTIPIWLVRSDWTALAEIEILTQTRTPAQVIGKFRVLHAYSDTEQAAITGVFRRLYASEGDPNIYVLISGADYKQAMTTGFYAPPSLSAEGFVHASPSAQLNRVANKYYSGTKDVQLLEVALAKIIPEVKWEPATGGLYPHIYGCLNMDAVALSVPVAPGANGMFDIKV